MDGYGLWYYENGGTLWVIERTDTNQFLVNKKGFHERYTNGVLDADKWYDTLPQLNNGFFYFSTEDYYPTKELAEKFAPKELREGGCDCCGHGSVNIPIRLTEHEFLT